MTSRFLLFSELNITEQIVLSGIRTWANNIKFNKISNFVREFVRSDYANVRYFIKNKFTLSELQKTFINLGINKKQFHEKRNFRKWLFVQNKDNLFIEETNLMQHGNHRPAKLYKPLDRID